MFSISRIAYRREGVFFPTENALPGKGMGVHSAGEVCYLQLPCFKFCITITKHPSSFVTNTDK